VVTLAQPGAAAEPGTVRVPVVPGPRAAAVAALDAVALARGLRSRPDVVLCCHIVCAPTAIALARLRGVPYVQWAYGKELPARPALARRAFAGAAAVISISRHTSGLVRGLGAHEERIALVPPGVDLPETTAPAAERTGSRLVTVSRLADRYKGHDVILQALARVVEQHPGVVWTVVGDGPLRGELEADAARRGLDGHVRFVGSVGDAERDRALSGADVFVMPSRTAPDGTGEGFGIVYLEAGARGVPSVAGNAGGAVDAVRDGETGLLVDAASPDAVAGALLRLLDDDALRERLGRAAREHAQAFAWPRIAAQVRDVLAGAAYAGASSWRD
jgi:phosphatidylinositol alpha-1,6-mannosyltransferase